MGKDNEQKPDEQQRPN